MLPVGQGSNRARDRIDKQVDGRGQMLLDPPSRSKCPLMPGPSVAKPHFGHDLREAVGKIGILFRVDVAGRWFDDGNPIMLGGSVDREREFHRPPIGSTLIDEGYQFGGCLLGAIDHFHGNID
jgi:hypothetical protein